MIDGAVSRPFSAVTETFPRKPTANGQSDDDSALTYGGGTLVPLYRSLVSHHSCQISIDELVNGEHNAVRIAWGVAYSLAGFRSSRVRSTDF